MPRRTFLILLLGATSLLPYLAALGLGDLRQQTLLFVVVFIGAFLLYLLAVKLILNIQYTLHAPSRSIPLGRLTLPILIFGFGILFRLLLLPTKPTLSDDMYRYVWDGHLQSLGISPYRYPPNAPELADLRRGMSPIWRLINRKEFVTVYPPGAQLAFAAVWRVVGDHVTLFKAAFVLAELAGGVVLWQLLKHFNQPPEYSLIYFWSPLLIFEVAHAGHVDGLMLPLLILAFWARVKERHWLLGLALGAATLIKFFPVLLLPALLPLPRPFTLKGLQPVSQVLLAFVGISALAYLPYLFGSASPIGFLPKYFDENFNLGLARLVFSLADYWHWPRALLSNTLTFGGLALLGVAYLLRPAVSARVALIRCLSLIGWFTLFTQNLFAWYLLWLLPLITLWLEPGPFFGFRLTPVFAWFIFTGTVMLSYVFFVTWRVNLTAQNMEYWPLYLLLVAALVWPRLRREPT